MKTQTLCALAIAASALPPQAQAAGAHVHGRASLNLALEGNRIEVELDSPLEALLGFERAPRNAAERAAVAAMADQLRQGQALFDFGDSGCQLERVELESALLKPNPRESAAGHGDLNARWRFACARAVAGVVVGLFERFSGIRQLDAQWSSGARQGGARLTAARPGLKW